MDNAVGAVDIFRSAFRGLSSSFTENHLENLASIIPDAKGKKKTKVFVQTRPVTEADIGRHLSGVCGIGICPINGKNKCFYSVVDIDVYETLDVEYILSIIHDYDLPFEAFRSKSGGLHLYTFYSKEESAKDVREVLSRFVSCFALDVKFQTLEGVSKVEIFPKQNILPKDGRGSYVTLPYFNYKHSSMCMLAPDGKDVPFVKAMNIITGSFTSVKDFNNVLDELPYNDAPVCIQRGLLSKVLSEDSGRNDFLYTVGVYLKKKHGEDISDRLKSINALLPASLEDSEVQGIAASIMKNNGKFKCHGSVCRRFCDAKGCAKREYGVGKNKGHFTGIDFGPLVRMDARDPYYVWNLRLNDEDPYTSVIFKNEDELNNQNIFTRYCMRYLRKAPYMVQYNDWIDILNTAMDSMTVQKVSEAGDNTTLARVHRAFVRYLIAKKSPDNKPYQLRIGSVYTDETGNYCFTAEHFLEYIEHLKLSTGTLILSDALTRFGCVEGTVSYDTSDGRRINIPCWKKAPDDLLTGEDSLRKDIVAANKDSIIKAVKEIRQKPEEVPELEDSNEPNDF
jgi:hypothetical protein